MVAGPVVMRRDVARQRQAGCEYSAPRSDTDAQRGTGASEVWRHLETGKSAARAQVRHPSRLLATRVEDRTSEPLSLTCVKTLPETRFIII